MPSKMFGIITHSHAVFPAFFRIAVFYIGYVGREFVEDKLVKTFAIERLL